MRKNTRRHPSRLEAGIHEKKDQDGFLITHVGNGHSLLSSPQEVGGDPSEGKGSLDYRQKQAGMTAMGMDSDSVGIFFEPL